MNESLYGMYCRTKKLIEKATLHEDKNDERLNFLMEGWVGSNDAIEKAYPEIIDMYARRQAMFDSFTREQMDHICYQIGDWYMVWQDKMWVDGKPNQHWLGIAKEQLKTMICGE